MPIFKSLFLVLSFTLLLPANTLPLEKVTLQLQWKHQFEFAGFYAAKEKGFYKDVGLDVSFTEFNENTNIEDEVIKGNAQYGLSYSSIIAEYMRGKPLILVANFFKKSPLVLVAQENIKTPADLKGKKIMGLSHSIHNITLFNMLDIFNIHSEDVINIPASFNIDDFVSKKVDAMVAFTTNELYLLDQKGIKYHIFDPVVYGAQYYDVNLFTTKKELLEHPKRVKHFKEASIKGWEYALEHQEEVIEIILEKYNTQYKSKEALRFEAKQIENIMLPKVHKVGSIDINRVRSIAESFIQAGFIQPGTAKLKAFIFDYKKPVMTGSTLTPTIYLTDEEKKFIQKKKELKICVHPDRMPYEKIESGKHIGISADYMDHISSMLKMPIKLVTTKTWSESLALFKEGRCDILSLVASSDERKPYMELTKPYYSSPLVIATRYDKSFIPDIVELKEKKIGILRNKATSELLQHKYLDIDFVQVNTLSEGLERVNNGELYGFIDTLTTVSYQIQKRFPAQLKISGQLKENAVMGIGVQKNEPQLLHILNKTVNFVKDDTKKNILNDWVSVKFERSDSNVKTFWKILAPFLLLALLLILSHFALQQYNKRLKKQINLNVEELREKDEILIQKQRMADIGEMISMIAHQWRQPLGAINSTIMGINLKIASGKFNLDHPSDQKAFLEYLENKFTNINEYIQHLSTTTDDFRNFFNPNKSKENTHLIIPIENALQLVEKSMHKNGIEIHKDLQVNPECTLYSSEIIQVLLNILKNSQYNFIDKHTENPKIHIATFFRDDQTVISLCDNGGGIPKNITSKIFEPYFSTKSSKNGTGLGLYMSRIIIEAHHNGKLTMINKNGGVCFELIFKTQ